MLAILLRNPFVAGGRRSPGTFLRLLHHEPISKPFPTSPSSLKSDLAVSFFKTSCGLSPSAALAAAAKIGMKTTAKAESVLSLLRSYGFTNSNIALMAARFPALFSFHPENCIKPKLDLFVSAGFTRDSIAKIFSRNPTLLSYSLEMKLSRNLHLLMTTLGGDRKAVATSIVNNIRILFIDPKNNMFPNMETLRKHGVAGPNIARLIMLCPRTITQKPSRFSKSLALLEDMGFNPSNKLFLYGIRAITGLTPSTWERKLQFYRSIGWSHEETISAFKKYPLCMLNSEEKIRKVMDFFVENLEWEPSRLALHPIILNFSFEKRIVPRYTIFNILSTSGLSGMKLSFITLLRWSESKFLKYLCKYSDTIPELFEAYKVKLEMTIPSNIVL